MDAAGLDTAPNCNIGIVVGACVGVNAVEASVEEVIEVTVDDVRLAQHHHVAFSGRVAHSCSDVDLQDTTIENEFIYTYT